MRCQNADTRSSPGGACCRYARACSCWGLLTLWVATVPLLGRPDRASVHRPLPAPLGRASPPSALQVLILRVFPDGDPDLLAVCHLASYGLLFVFVAANLHVPGLPLLGLGGLLNAAGDRRQQRRHARRPGRARDAPASSRVPGEFANSAALADPKLWFLGDVFALPAGWPLANVFSVGDLLLLAGAFVLLHRVCRSRLAPPLDRARGARLARRPAASRSSATTAPSGGCGSRQAISGIGDWVFPPAVFAALVGGRRAGVRPRAAADRRRSARAWSSASSAARSSTASRASG